MRGLALVSVTAVVASCGADMPRGAELRIAVDTLAGVEYVRMSGTPPTLDVNVGVRIGSGGGAGPARPDEFGMIRSLVGDAEGTVFVADQQANEIRVFGRDGAHLRTIGRSGGGPGEFGVLYSLAWIGDTLAAFDPRNSRIGFLTRAGEWLASVPYFPLTGSPMLVRFYPAGGEATYILGFRRVEDRNQRIFIRVTGGGLADTLSVPELPAGDGPRSVVFCPHPDGSGFSYFETPFAPVRLLAPAPGGVFATARSAEYRIVFVTPAGDTVRVVERDHLPYPVTDEEWEAGTSDYRRFREEVPGARCEPSGPSRPEVKPAIRHLFFDAEGRMWVEAYAADGVVYDVFDRDGRLIGTVDVPDRHEDLPPYSRGGWLYQVEVDDLGVHYVRSYRVPVLATSS